MSKFSYYSYLYLYLGLNWLQCQQGPKGGAVRIYVRFEMFSVFVD